MNYSTSILILSTLLVSFSVLAQSISYTLAFKILPGGNTKVSYHILHIENNNTIVKSEAISQSNFVRYGKALTKSKANPLNFDLFKVHGIDCGLIIDESIRITKLGDTVQYLDTLWEEFDDLCLPLYDIWKLKDSISPVYSKFVTEKEVLPEDIGWGANRYRPSHKQTLFLQKYGINNIYDYFYGSNMFKLLRDMQNEDWIEHYRDLTD